MIFLYAGSTVESLVVIRLALERLEYIKCGQK
jgi:hypothetical protein